MVRLLRTLTSRSRFDVSEGRDSMLGTCWSNPDATTSPPNIPLPVDSLGATSDAVDSYIFGVITAQRPAPKTVMRAMSAISRRRRQSTTMKLTTGTASLDSRPTASSRRSGRRSLIASFDWLIGWHEMTQLLDHSLRVARGGQTIQLGDF